LGFQNFISASGHINDDEESNTDSASVASAPPFRQLSTLMKSHDDDGNKVINEYVVVKELGKGAFGKVKLARSVGQVNREVAIKIIKRGRRRESYVPRRISIKPSFGESATATLEGGVRDSLPETPVSASPLTKEGIARREIAIMKKLRHRNIVSLHAVIDDATSDKMYLVMDYVPNGTLVRPAEGAAREAGLLYEPLEEEQCRDVFRQLVDGLRYLHRNGICHRDIKPENILCGSGGRVYLSDFGVSEIMSVQGSVSTKSSGTPTFWPPEMFSFETETLVSGAQVDIWALGVTLYMMLCGRSPFRGTSFLELSKSITCDEVTFPLVLSEDAKDLLTAMLAKDPAKRPGLKDIKAHPFLTGIASQPADSRRRSTFADLELFQPTPAEINAAITGLRMPEIISVEQSNNSTGGYSAQPMLVDEAISSLPPQCPPFASMTPNCPMVVLDHDNAAPQRLAESGKSDEFASYQSSKRASINSNTIQRVPSGSTLPEGTHSPEQSSGYPSSHRVSIGSDASTETFRSGSGARPPALLASPPRKHLPDAPASPTGPPLRVHSGGALRTSLYAPQETRPAPEEASHPTERGS
jgi:[calcium/calmodulin-dependent protein kinase] kinase